MKFHGELEFRGFGNSCLLEKMTFTTKKMAIETICASHMLLSGRRKTRKEKNVFFQKKKDVVES